MDMQVYLGNVKGDDPLRRDHRQFVRREGGRRSRRHEALRLVSRQRASRTAGGGAAAPPLVAERRRARPMTTAATQVPVIGELSFALDAGRDRQHRRPVGLREDHAAQHAVRADSALGRARCAGTAQRLRACRPKVGYMLQKDLLFPWRTALANVMLGHGDRGRATRRGARAGARAARPARPARLRRRTIPRRCRAACGSAWRSPARWSTIRTCCCSTSPSPRSTSRPSC